jgi:hypothetical protein
LLLLSVAADKLQTLRKRTSPAKIAWHRPRKYPFANSVRNSSTFQVTGAFAEFERGMIRQRIHAGLNALI